MRRCGRPVDAFRPFCFTALVGVSGRFGRCKGGLIRPLIFGAVKSPVVCGCLGLQDRPSVTDRPFRVACSGYLPEPHFRLSVLRSITAPDKRFEQLLKPLSSFST